VVEIFKRSNLPRLRSAADADAMMAMPMPKAIKSGFMAMDDNYAGMKSHQKQK